jgi:hypothetical protein
MLIAEDDEISAIWPEGKQSNDAKKRYKLIKEAFRNGFLLEMIEKSETLDPGQIPDSELSEECREWLDEIISAISAEVGRALVEILILQLSIKVICPAQDVRLHKGYWAEGLSMRSLDKEYVRPALSSKDLLRMNRDGAFMTRSFAENYPFTVYYKADIRGAKGTAKELWLRFVNRVESNEVDAGAALLFALGLLKTKSDEFKQMVEVMLNALEDWIRGKQPVLLNKAADMIKSHIEESASHARLLEIAIHSFMQALEENDVDLGGSLKQLMPMRTANLKHGNIGDVEVVLGKHIIEAWDAKYRTPYLSDFLDELLTKIEDRDVSDLRFGFIVFPERIEYDDDKNKVKEIEDEYEIEVEVYSLDEWLQAEMKVAESFGVSEGTLAESWLTAYCKSLGQKKRDIAPIDEPTFFWVESLLSLFSKS